jgi:hypothetical protein
MTDITVTSGNYKIRSTSSNDSLRIIGLGKDVAFVAYAPAYGKAALARNVTDKQIHALLKELSNEKFDSAAEGSIEIQLIGKENAFTALVERLNKIDARHVLNVVSKNSKFDSVKYSPASNSLEPLVVTIPWVGKSANSVGGRGGI